MIQKNNLPFPRWWERDDANSGLARGYAFLPALLVLAGLSACVTINIYFPAAAAEKAADKIIDEVWQLKEGIKPTAPAPAKQQ